MGAGKTTVGRLLAPMLGWRFVDADALLCEQTGSTVAQIFREQGEAHFRALEAVLIADLVNQSDTVIALGGGAVENAQTRALLHADPSTLLVYLETTLAIALRRCAADAGGLARPVLADTAHLQSRFETRLPLYRQAHRVLSAGEHSPESLATEIAAAVRR